MKNLSPRLLMMGVLIAGPACAQLVSKPDVRLSTISASEVLLAIRPPSIPTDAIDPFNSPSFNSNSQPSANETVKTAPRGDREILAAIAAQLKPSGNFIIGGQQTLIFGQKRVKAGTPMTINFEGVDYAIEITAVERTSFTLRLNREELTRPIK